MNSEQTLNKLQNEFGTAQFNQNWVSQDWNWWDMVGYAAAAQFNYFSQPAGSLDPQLAIAKTTEQTNLVLPNQIGGTECFVVTQIRCFILIAAKVRQTGTAVATDTVFSARQRAATRLVEAIMNNGAATWTINQKEYAVQTLPWQTFPAGFGLGDVFPPVSVAADGSGLYGGTNAYANTSPYDIDGGQRGDTFSQGQPIFLAPNTQFQFKIQFPLGTTAPSNANIYGASNDQPATIWTGCILGGQKVRPRG
jgi:hypothetical protein